VEKLPKMEAQPDLDEADPDVGPADLEATEEVDKGRESNLPLPELSQRDSPSSKDPLNQRRK